MRRSLFATALIALAAACGEEPKENKPELARAKVADATRQLDQGSLGAARTSYDAAVALDPTRADASFGSALIDLLTLPDAAPVDALLTQCGQPVLDLEHDVFGPDGFLAKEAAFNTGTASVSVLERESSTAAWKDTGFVADQVRAYLTTSGALTLEVRDSSGNAGDVKQLSLIVNPADVRQGDSAVTPLVDGVQSEVVDLAGEITADGWISSYGEGNVSSSYYRPCHSGTITFVKAGKTLGATVQVQLDNVLLPQGYSTSNGQCNEVYGGRRLSGTFTDTIQVLPEIDKDKLPFVNIKSDPGPPYRDEIIVALERCQNITWDQLTARALEMEQILEKAATKVGKAVAKGDSFSYTIPAGLFHTSADIKVNAVDARLFKAALDAGAGFMHLVASYRVIEGPFAALLRDIQQWIGYDQSLEQRLERTFEPAVTVAELNQSFLARMAGFDLSPVQARLDKVFEGVAAAMRIAGAQPGIFDFSNADSLALAERVAAIADALRSSLTSPTPVALPGNPDYKVHLKAFFDDPLDRDRLLALSGLTSLFYVDEGNDASSDGWERNDRVRVHEPENMADLDKWLGALWTAPSGSNAPELVLIDEDVLERTNQDGWPAFINHDLATLTPGVEDAVP